MTPAFAGLLVVAGALLLWEGRGTTYFNFDDISQFYALSWSPSALLTPYNGHLILTSRLLFHLASSIFGANYAVLRLLAVLSVLAADVMFFLLARRLVAPAIALAASLPVLFLGTAWEAMLWPAGALAMAFATAAGLAAFVALQSGRRHRDLAACLLLTLSLASFSIGVCFAAGVAVWILTAEDRWRRAWVFVGPLALWGAWWLWARKFGESQLVASHAIDLPVQYLKSLAWVVGAGTGVTGIGAPSVAFNIAPAPRVSAAPELAALVVIGVGLLLWRRWPPPRELWPPLVALLLFWTLTGLAPGANHGPSASRYMLPGVVLLLLVVLAAARRVSLGRNGFAIVYAAAAVMVALNLVVLQRAHDFFTAYSTNARAQFAMIELGGTHVNPEFNPQAATPAASSSWLGMRAADYLAGVARYGSPADSLAEVRASSEPIRQRADQVLAAAIGLGLRPTRARAWSACQTAPSGSSMRVQYPGGAVALRADATSALLVGRFGNVPSAGIAFMKPRAWYRLVTPPGRLARDWRLSATGDAHLTLCRLRQ